MLSGQYLIFCYLFLAANWVCVLVLRRRAKHSSSGAQRTIEDDE